MKTTDNQTHTTIELETHEGQQTFLSGMKGGDDRRQWNRSPETCELATWLSQNQSSSQVFVKCGDVYKQVK